MSDLTTLSIDWILRSAVVFVPIGFVLYVRRNWTSPALRFVILQVTFFAVCLMPFIPQVLPQVGVIPRGEMLSLMGDFEPIVADAGVVDATASTEAAVTIAPVERARVPVFALIWIGGTLLLLARLGWSGLALFRPARRGSFQTRESVRIVTGESGTRPMAWGVFRRMVTLPAESEHWPESTRQSVIAHELAHHARRDPLWLLVSEVLLALGWINPVLWALRAWQCVERERATDDRVLISESVRPSDYAEALSRLADERWKPTLPMATAIAMGSAIASRAMRALDREAPRAIPGSGKITYIAISILAIAAVTSPLAQEAAEPIALQVVIDPGHGAHDSGAKRDGFLEKDLNLLLSNVVAGHLRRRGAEVVLTREEDRFLSLDDRAQFASETAAAFDGETVLISIHHNSSSDIYKSGIELLLLDNDESSKPLGRSIAKQLTGDLGTDLVTVKASRMSLLREAKLPRVFIEAGYLSNPGDLAKVTDEDYRDLMGKAIADGILRIHGATERAEAVSPSDLPLADGFDYPVGQGESDGFYVFRGFTPNGHLGDDFNGVRGGNSDLGLPVTSIGDGVVVFAKDARGGWGNVVITRHRYRDSADGEIKMIDALYGHLAVMDVKRGDRVTRGQSVGTIGRGPNQMYAAHLHFEIRKNLQIGLDRGLFTRGYENYHSPRRFLSAHRQLGERSDSGQN